jgi:hypothetical protein
MLSNTDQGMVISSYVASTIAYERRKSASHAGMTRPRPSFYPASSARRIIKFVLGQLPNCEMLLREAALGAVKLGLVTKNDACQSLLESVQIEICVAKAAQAIECGDSVLTAAVNSSDSLNMEGVWDAIDFYHETIVQVKEKDIEI